MPPRAKSLPPPALPFQGKSVLNAPFRDVVGCEAPTGGITSTHVSAGPADEFATRQITPLDAPLAHASEWYGAEHPYFQNVAYAPFTGA